MRLVERTVDRFGGVDVVVNNAANALTMPIAETTIAGWEKSMAVNLQGPVFLASAAHPHLRRSEHAAILNVISVGAITYAPSQAMYAAAKAGAARLHPQHGGRVGGRRHPCQRPGTGHGRHRHGAQHRARSRSSG